MYSYNLYSKHLNHSIKLFTQKTRLLCNTQTHTECVKQSNNFVFSIDPANCSDFDDALSIQYINDRICVSIYIADVVSNMETHNLWDFFTERVSSIYLPHKRLSMIPPSFTEKFCSLQQNRINKSVRIDFYFNNDGTEIFEGNINMVDIHIDKNFVYEEESLINNPQYASLLNLTKLIEPSIKDSHELVSFWMIKTNRRCSKHLNMNKNGIFKKSQHTNELKYDNSNVISSQYVLYGDNDTTSDELYTHVTSPIRRIVDVLNQMIMYESISTKVLSEFALKFLSLWLSKIHFINKSMKAIREVQFDCNLLNYFDDKPNISDRTYECLIIDKKEYNSRLFSYTIFVPDIKLFSNTTKSNRDVEINSSQKIVFFVFNTEYNLNKRIRVMINPMG
jgi:RNB domain